MHPPNAPESPEQEPLFHINKKTTGGSEDFHLFPRDPSSSTPVALPMSSTPNDVFLIVRSFKNEHGIHVGCGIKTGDILKMGRLEYLVAEMRVSNENDKLFTHSKEPDSSENNYTVVPVTHQSPEAKKTCRICLLEEGMGKTEEEDFLVSPCYCKGSCGYVHINCLKEWIKNKTVIKPSGCAVTYQWKKLECEVCKKALPKKMMLKNQIFELVTIEKPLTPYLVLEKICRETKTITSATIIQFLPGETIKIGRGHQCDLRISDISVSRLHSKIIYDKGAFRIFDNNSKFGTLVMLQEPYRITEEKVAVQVGRTVITFAQRKEKQDEIRHGFASSSMMAEGRHAFVGPSMLEGLSNIHLFQGAPHLVAETPGNQSHQPVPQIPPYSSLPMNPQNAGSPLYDLSGHATFMQLPLLGFQEMNEKLGEAKPQNEANDKSKNQKK